MIPIVDSLLIGGAVGTVWGLHDNKKKAQEQAQGASKAPSGLNASTWYPPEPAQAAQPQGRGTATHSSATQPQDQQNLSPDQFTGLNKVAARAGAAVCKWKKDRGYQ